jgi:hypothetical protein
MSIRRGSDGCTGQFSQKIGAGQINFVLTNASFVADFRRPASPVHARKDPGTASLRLQISGAGT